MHRSYPSPLSSAGTLRCHLPGESTPSEVVQPELPDNRYRGLGKRGTVWLSDAQPSGRVPLMPRRRRETP
jgi:hypothetical protein